MYFDCFWRAPNEWLKGPEIALYTNSAWEAIQDGGEADPFCVNPNYFVLASSDTHSVLKVRVEAHNLAMWVATVPDGTDPFSWAAVEALDLTNFYRGVTIEETRHFCPEFDVMVDIKDEEGNIIGVEPLLKDTTIL